MDLFETLQKKQRRTKFESSDEMAFFLDYNGLLSDYESFAFFRKAQKPFDVIRANIILRAILNKNAIEQAYGKAKAKGKEAIHEAVSEVLEKLPYVESKGEKIYIPILSRSLNHIYVNETEKLGVAPYRSLVRNDSASAVDPFDYYGPELFNSFFTKMILVKKNKESMAFYDYDSASIYFLNWEGRLDVCCALFDRYLAHPSTNHMLERLTPAVNAYYAENRDGFLKALVDNKLISSRLIYKINFDESRHNLKLFSDVNH